MNIKRREKLIASLKDKKYRDAFVSEHIDTGLPFQIKELREKAGWSQEELGSRAGMHQERISTLEDPNYSKFTLKTLKRLASAFDVALMVVFVPFSKLVDWESNLSPESLHPLPFERDNFSRENLGEEETINEKINPPQAPQPYPELILGTPSVTPKRTSVLDQAFKFEKEPQKSELIKIMRNANETSLNSPRPINLAGTVN